MNKGKPGVKDFAQTRDWTPAPSFQPVVITMSYNAPWSETKNLQQNLNTLLDKYVSLQKHMRNCKKLNYDFELLRNKTFLKQIFSKFFAQIL